MEGYEGRVIFFYLGMMRCKADVPFVHVSTFHWYTGGNGGQVLEVSFSLLKISWQMNVFGISKDVLMICGKK